MVSKENIVTKRVRAKHVFRTWEEPLNELLNSEYMKNLYTYLEYKYVTSSFMRPAINQIYAPFRFCNYSEVKMVFFTNLKVHQTNANGNGAGIIAGSVDYPYILSSIRKNVKENFYKHISAPLFDETLEDYSKQGILMINSSLTSSTQELHDTLWRHFIRMLISKISDSKNKIAFVFLTEGCNHFKPYIDIKKHKIFENKAYTLEPTCRVIQRADEYIYDNYSREEQIQW